MSLFLQCEFDKQIRIGVWNIYKNYSLNIQDRDILILDKAVI